MNIKDNLGKISWSFIDKGNYLLFGLFILFQAKFLEPSDFAFFESMVLVNNWIFLLGDGLALNGLIQFGGHKKDRPYINFLSLSVLSIFALSISMLFYLARVPIGNLLNDTSFAVGLSYLPIVSLLTIPRNFALKMLNRDLKYFSIFVLNFIFFGTQVLTTLYILTIQDSLYFLNMIQILLWGGGASAFISIILIRKELKFSTGGALPFKKFINFGFVVIQQQIFHSIPKIFDFHIISIFFGPEKAGIYALAKKLYKTFDEAASAAHSLIYPISVKLIAQKNWEGLKALTTKSLSALLFVFAFLVLILNLGLTDFLISLFDLKQYIASIDIFNNLVLAGLFLPFALLTPLMNALSKEKKVLTYKIIAMASSLSFLFAISYFGVFQGVAFSIVIYNLVLGILCFIFVRSELKFKTTDIFRFSSDIKNVILRK